MMRPYTALFPLLLFLTQYSFGQFKNTFASNGNPTTQIIDPSGMKQGDWNYYDASDQIFRIETYSNNVLMNNTYVLNGSKINIKDYQHLQLSELSPQIVDFITKKLQPIGKGEIIILQDGSVHMHFYFDKLKAKISPELTLDPIKQLSLKSSTIKF